MGGLEHICTELQHIVEAIHAVTSIDITVVDDRLVRVAGTGPLAGEIGRSAPRNSAFHKCLQSGQTYFIRNPRCDEVCLGCAGRENCRELAELCLPIKSEGKTIGVLGMCAFDAEAEQHFTHNHEDFLRFESQLSTLISAVLGERRYGTLAEYRSSELSALINSVNEGILVLSADGTILTVNRYLTER
ncbi:MAG: GAF domain-containing protein, partial [Oscillospiraceae bacterium]